MNNSKITIRVFTDPTCPFAYSTEPARWRLKWLFGDQIQWQQTVVVLSSTQEDHDRKSFTPDKQAASLHRLKLSHGMPINDSERPRMAVSVHACKAYVATLLNTPEKADQVLRQLRIAAMCGELIDEPEVIHAAVAKAGIDAADLDAWLAQSRVETALQKDMQEARDPALAARALEYKLSSLFEGGFRYSTPSYQFYKAGELVFEVPGFWAQPFYDVIIANIAPDLQRKPDPENVTEVLEWAEEPLATVEVAAIMGKAADDVRPLLESAAQCTSSGQDGFWSL